MSISSSQYVLTQNGHISSAQKWYATDGYQFISEKQYTLGNITLMSCISGELVEKNGTQLESYYTSKQQKKRF